KITTSFLGEANTVFYTVVQTGQNNITAGKVTTSASGGGVFKGNITLSPGTYAVGLLIYLDGKTDSPVAVSVPRAIQITLPVTSQTSTSPTATTTRTSSTGSETSHTSSTTVTES